MGAKSRRGLVLGRSRGQRIYILLEDGREISVEVMEARTNFTRLRVVAPDAIRVLRDDHPERRKG